MIIGNLTLTPTLRDGMWYINWVLRVSTDDAARAKDRDLVKRWNMHQLRWCAGKDGLGRYYNTKKHAQETIQTFRDKEAKNGLRLRTKRALPTS